MLYIGIDLGTSAVKLLLVDEKGYIVNEVSKEYPVYFPHSGWSEQNPEDWKNAVFEGLTELLKDADKSAVKGIGCGGQMHGLVVLDENDDVIRPAILWNDGRTHKEVDFLNNVIGKDVLSENTANIAFAGFTAPKILWMKNNEPELFKKVTGLTVKDFNLLVSLNVFNESLMNDAVYKFKRYEDASLSYTGINRHEGEKVGLYNTVLSKDDFELLAKIQKQSV